MGRRLQVDMATTSRVEAPAWKRDYLKPPTEFATGDSIATFLEQMDNFISLSGGDKDFAVYMLINRLQEDVRFNLFALPNFNEHSTDYAWLTLQLRHLYQRKSTTISPLVELLKVHQANGQNLDDFASSLRVLAYKTMGNAEPQLREKFLVTAFWNGIQDQTLRTALQTHTPHTLGDALQEAKSNFRRPTTDGDNIPTLRTMHETSNMQLGDLKCEIMGLKEQLQYVINLLNIQNRNQGRVPHHMPPGKPQREAATSSNVICFNCGLRGHISRNCRRPRTQATQNRPDNRRFRYMDDGSGSFGNASEHIQGEATSSLNVGQLTVEKYDAGMVKSNVPTPSSLNVEQHIVNKSYASALKSNMPPAPKPPSTRHRNINKGNQVQQWVNFVNGGNSRPNKPIHQLGAATVISRSHSERAANKPIIIGSCETLEAKMLFDTGAEVNLIDSGFLMDIQKQNPQIAVSPSRRTIKCANNSTMCTRGSVWLSFRVGSQTISAQFTVAESLFPKVIVGIRLMKTAGVQVRPADDCIVIGEETIPFLSKVIPSFGLKE